MFPDRVKKVTHKDTLDTDLDKDTFCDLCISLGDLIFGAVLEGSDYFFIFRVIQSFMNFIFQILYQLNSLKKLWLRFVCCWKLRQVIEKNQGMKYFKMISKG